MQVVAGAFLFLTTEEKIRQEGDGRKRIRVQRKVMMYRHALMQGMVVCVLCVRMA